MKRQLYMSDTFLTKFLYYRQLAGTIILVKNDTSAIIAHSFINHYWLNEPFINILSMRPHDGMNVPWYIVSLTIIVVAFFGVIGAVATNAFYHHFTQLMHALADTTASMIRNATIGIFAVYHHIRKFLQYLSRVLSRSLVDAALMNNRLVSFRRIASLYWWHHFLKIFNLRRADASPRRFVHHRRLMKWALLSIRRQRLRRRLFDDRRSAAISCGIKATLAVATRLSRARQPHGRDAPLYHNGWWGDTFGEMLKTLMAIVFIAIRSIFIWPCRLWATIDDMKMYCFIYIAFSIKVNHWCWWFMGRH